jgi:hypothetical protein
MRRLVCLLALCAVAGCTSSRPSITEEMKQHPPSSMGPGTVGIWATSATPLLPTWPRVKTWTARITSCNPGAPDVSAVTEDGLPVTVRVLHPSGREARLAATVEYAPDGGQPRQDANDVRVLVVSEIPLEPAGAEDGTHGDFSGGIVHGPAGGAPTGDSEGTLAHVSWRCP